MGAAAASWRIVMNSMRLYPDAEKRTSPNIEKKTLTVKSYGKISPYQEIMYARTVYVDGHRKDIHEIIFGDATKEKLKKLAERRLYRF